jgi:hypothetical protein
VSAVRRVGEMTAITCPQLGALALVGLTVALLLPTNPLPAAARAIETAA